MADFHPDLAAAAVHALGCGPAAAREAHALWQRVLHSPAFRSDAQRYAAVLGPPEVEEDHRLGALPTVVRQWTLGAVWRDLVWQVVSLPDGSSVLAELVRAPGSLPPRLPADPWQLEPWSCVVRDVVHAYEVRETGEGDATSRWYAEGDGAADGGRPWRAVFVWGLLQVVQDPPLERQPP